MPIDSTYMAVPDACLPQSSLWVGVLMVPDACR